MCVVALGVRDHPASNEASTSVAGVGTAAAGAGPQRANADAASGRDEQLRVYREAFETQMLANTEEFYAKEATYFIEHNSFTAYMQRVEQRLKVSFRHI
jgi:hypothetical protein